MPMYYSIIARGTVVLASYATLPGNFSEVTEQILSKIAPEDGKMSLSHNSFLFHYICENRIIYMCITDDEFERSRAFLFLNEIKRRFKSSFGDRAQTAIAYAMNNEFAPVMHSQIKYFSEAKDIETISRVNSELDELKGIMVRNIDTIASRGENLQLLFDKAEHLNQSSVSFRVQSRNLQRSLFWKNVKIYVVAGGIAVAIFYLFLVMLCGGFGLGECV